MNASQCNQKSMMNEKVDKNNQNICSDDDGQGEVTENERENLVNVLQNNVTLSFGNTGEM